MRFYYKIQKHGIPIRSSKTTRSTLYDNNLYWSDHLYFRYRINVNYFKKLEWDLKWIWWWVIIYRNWNRHNRTDIGFHWTYRGLYDQIQLSLVNCPFQHLERSVRINLHHSWITYTKSSKSLSNQLWKLFPHTTLFEKAKNLVKSDRRDHVLRNMSMQFRSWKF